MRKGKYTILLMCGDESYMIARNWTGRLSSAEKLAKKLVLDHVTDYPDAQAIIYDDSDEFNVFPEKDFQRYYDDWLTHESYGEYDEFRLQNIFFKATTAPYNKYIRNYEES